MLVFIVLAVIVATPAFLAVTKPFASTTATSSLEEYHDTLLSVVSAGLTVALSCNVSPVFITLGFLLSITIFQVQLFS